MSTPSGKFLVRVPPELHLRVRLAAERNGVSMNTWIEQAVADYLGMEYVPAKYVKRRKHGASQKKASKASARRVSDV